jgi:prepilin-type N-terminal cleavage/methylation domain-containing protein
MKTNRHKALTARPVPASGFTVIEILIVLAIAALFLLAVFLALPALQRNERNDSRKRSVELINGLMQEYYAQNTLTYPDTPAQMCQFITNFLQDINPGQGACTPVYNGAKQCVLVSGDRFTVCYHERAGSPHSYIGPADEISIQLGHNCNPSQTGDPIVSIGGGPDSDTRHFAVWTALEPGRLCFDNYRD